jgi:hypothetical protein
MKKILVTTLVAAMIGSASVAYADATVEAGRLSCDVEGGIGLIFTSSKDLTCQFMRKGHKTETYSGKIEKFGLDIGFTQRTHIEWLVLTASGNKVTNGALAGTYVGASAEATLGIGLGGNLLVGGSSKAYTLQPLSIQGQTGLDYSIAFTGLTLR